MRPEHRPEQNGADHQRQRYENEKGPAIPKVLLPFATDYPVNHATNRADQNLSEHGGADAELFQMIVAADAAHDPKERFRRNENTEAIAQNHQRSRDLKDPCQQKHGEGHRNSGNEPREEATKHYFGSAHHLLI